jgi:hypothetical protein
MGEVVFVAGQGLQEGFSRGETAEVEGLRPGFFVEVGDEVVVAVARTIGDLALRGRSWSSTRFDLLVDKRHVLSFASLSSGFYVFVVPVAVGVPPLDVFASDRFMASTVFLQKREESVALFGGFAVHLLACGLVVL